MRRLAVIGQPVSHSRSPAMQRAALAELGLAEEWTYEALELSAEEFAERVPKLADEGFAGANVTIPHKERALALATESSERARKIGAANTLTFGAGGDVAADNTDAAALIAAIGPVEHGAPALVLGAGGAARAAAWALREAGADVTVWNRTAARAAALASGFRISAVPEGGSPDASRAAVIVNATSVGLGADTGLSSLPLDLSDLHPGQVVADLPYGDRETELSIAARRAGATLIDGIELLVRQGAESLRVWTGLEPPLEAMRAAARR